MRIKDIQRKFYNLKDRLDPQIIQREKRKQRAKGLAKGIAIGSIISGATALLLSPDTGKNNRKKAKEQMKKTKETIETNLVDGKEKLTEIYGDGKEKLEDKAKTLKLKLKTNEVIEEILEDGEYDQEDIVEYIEELVDEEI